MYSDTLIRSPVPSVCSSRLSSPLTASMIVRSRSSRANRAAVSVLPVVPNNRSKTARGSRSTGSGVVGFRHEIVFV